MAAKKGCFCEAPPRPAVSIGEMNETEQQNGWILTVREMYFFRGNALDATFPDKKRLIIDSVVE